jgi:hypothetical protein
MYYKMAQYGFWTVLLGNHPPAKPGALEFVSRSKRLTGVANAARRFLGTSKNLRFEKSAFVKSGSCIINLY